MTAKLTRDAARKAARSFSAAVFANYDLQWGVGTVEAHLPLGWTFGAGCCENDFAPFTVEAIADAIRWHARRIDDYAA